MFVLICNINKFEKIIPGTYMNNTKARKYLQSLTGWLMLRYVLRFPAQYVADEENQSSWLKELHPMELFMENSSNPCYEETAFPDGMFELERIGQFLHSISEEKRHGHGEEMNDDRREEYKNRARYDFEVLKDYILEGIPIIYGEDGKPELSKKQNQIRPFYFNISHSGSYVAFAWDAEGAIGVDIEDSSRREQTLFLAERYFTKEEVLYLHDLPLREQNDEFTRLWCHKEAYGKMLGCGLKNRILEKNMLEKDEPLLFLEQKIGDYFWVVVCMKSRNKV